MTSDDQGVPDRQPPIVVPPTDGDFYETLAENTSEGLLTIDVNSTIVYANPAIEEILGHEPAALVGSSKLEIIPERLRPVHERALQAYVETGTRGIDWNGVELPALHADGHEVPVSISLREHEYQGVRLFTGVFRDISERKERERTLQNHNRRLEELTSVLSHDIKNPLNVAQGYAELLSEEIDRDELRELAESLDRIEELVDESLVKDGTPETIDPTSTVSVESVAVQSWRWVTTDDATLEIDGTLGMVDADERLLTSLFENLFNNAVEHGGADVTVRVAPLEGADGFVVEDDGAGLSGADRGRLFEHGYSTNETGTGLGLARISHIADGHGWEIRTGESSAGGARFEFYT